MIELRCEKERIQGKLHWKAGVRIGRLHIGGFFPMCINSGVYKRKLLSVNAWDHWVYIKRFPHGIHLRVLWFAIGWKWSRRPENFNYRTAAKPLFRKKR